MEVTLEEDSLTTSGDMLALCVLSFVCGVLALTPYKGPEPKLPKRSPFGYGHLATGGATNSSARYLVTNSTELREALALPYTKTIYVKGVIHGNQLANGTLATCQTYIDITGSEGAAIRQFNFTQYVLSTNATYTAEVALAAVQGVPFEGRNATEYKALLATMNGWRPVVQNSQKAAVAFSVKSNTTIVGLDSSSALDGITLSLNVADNVVVRNLKLVSPADCFPAPETYPSSWNAKYDAMSLVTATNVWVDGCELQDQLSGEFVQPGYLWPGWEVDRFDGLFDCEDGTDNVTFSHNIVRNHHKSLLLGGGTKEADRDLGKMRFTLFGNMFNHSASRNPLMRFGTFEISSNLFVSTNDKSPLFEVGTGTARRGNSERDTTQSSAVPLDAVHQYHMGIYNQSKVWLSDNTFKQSGSVPDDISRIFTITESTNASLPAKVCVDAGSFVPKMNGKVKVDVGALVNKTLDYAISAGKAVQGGVVLSCQGVERSVGVPRNFKTNAEVEAYVISNAGMAKC